VRTDPDRAACRLPAPRFSAAGDRAIAAHFGHEKNPYLNAAIQELAARMREEPGVEEAIPGYASLLVVFTPGRTTGRGVCDAIERAASQPSTMREREWRLVSIPVAYGGEHGPDLAELARRTGLTQDQVIRIHSSSTYYAYCLGFSPGFAYLGGLDARLACPRLDSPRVRVPAGSVAIGGVQTAVYPQALPGGWRLIGRTPLALFDVDRNPPSAIRPGDFVRFVPLDSTGERFGPTLDRNSLPLRRVLSSEEALALLAEVARRDSRG